MKQTPELDRIQASMRPGVIVLDGFLGDDKRNLADILVEDAAAVRRFGLTHGQLADRMQLFRDAGAKGLGIGVHVAPHYEVHVDGVRGVLPCPFSHGVALPKVNVVVKNERLRETISFTGLGMHLIAIHGFYGGRHSPFRCAPGDLVRILEVDTSNLDR